jgi:DNA-binding CsgD family transcriptional regulator
MNRARLSIVGGSDNQPGSRLATSSGSPVGRISRSTFSANSLLPSLGRLAARVGHADFYEVALELIGGLVSCDRRLVMRYSRFDRPGFIVNQSLPSNYEASYLDGLYRFDPLFRFVRSGEATGVMTFRDMRESQPVDSFYDEFFASVMIHDELAVMLPAVGGICIALCFDRDRRRFRDAEVFKLRQLYSLIDTLHRLHIERILIGSRGGSPFDVKMAVLLTDADGRPLFFNPTWETLAGRVDEGKLAAATSAQPSGEHVIDEDHVLHWETFPQSNAVVPGGRIHMIERSSPGYFNANAQVIFRAFADRFHLTPREKEIVWLMLRGYPTSMIAKALAVSPGTVKNHRYRIYFKLDITTEREIFSLFLNDILLAN